jgi:CheY-like chemotaxis protein
MIQRAKRTARPVASRRAGFKRPLVLVVEDNDDVRQMYADLLSFFGLGVVEAYNGVEAVALGRALQPDLIVMDMALPVMDGATATRKLKGAFPTSPIPVIAVTGFSADHYLSRARAAGCDAFLTKPCSLELLDEVSRLLGV